MTLRVHPREIVAGSASDLLGLHDSWARAPLGDVATVQNGFAFKSEQFSQNEGMPLLRIRDVGRSSTATRFEGEFDPAYVVRSGDLIIGMDGDFRIARWTGPDALLNQRVCRLATRDPDLYDEGFLLYALPGYLDAINGATSSVTVKHLSSRTVAEIPVPLAPIAEQRRIVAAIEEQFSRLDAADQSIAAAQRRLESFVVSAASGSVQGDWPRVPLGAITDHQTYGTSAKANEDPTGVPVLRMGNIQNGRIDLDKLKYLPASHPDVEKFSLAPGDLLFNRTNSPELVGKTAVFTSGPTPTIFASYLIRLRLGSDCIPEWAALVINGPIGRRYVASVRTQQVGQANVNGTKLAAMEIPLPPLHEQRRIVAEVEQRLSVIDAMRDAITAAQRRSAALRRSIRERAFRGELVPQDPSDEPASVLLEGIRAERAAQPKPARALRRAGAAPTP